MYDMHHDTDSLFRAFTHQLSHSLTPNSEEHKAATLKAREELAEYIEQNVDEMDELIAHCNSETNLYGDLSTSEGKLQKFICNLKEGEERGGLEVLPAMALLKNSKVTVYKEKGRTLMFNPEGSVDIKLIQRLACLTTMEPS